MTESIKVGVVGVKRLITICFISGLLLGFMIGVGVMI